MDPCGRYNESGEIPILDFLRLILDLDVVMGEILTNCNDNVSSRLLVKIRLAERNFLGPPADLYKKPQTEAFCRTPLTITLRFRRCTSLLMLGRS